MVYIYTTVYTHTPDSFIKHYYLWVIGGTYIIYILIYKSVYLHKHICWHIRWFVYSGQTEVSVLLFSYQKNARRARAAGAQCNNDELQEAFDDDDEESDFEGFEEVEIIEN